MWRRSHIQLTLCFTLTFCFSIIKINKQNTYHACALHYSRVFLLFVSSVPKFKNRFSFLRFDCCRGACL